MEQFERTILEDGLEVVSAPQPGVRSVALGFWLDVGSRDEPESQAGVAHMLEHLAFKGTPTRSARDIAEMFDAVGGDLNAFTTKEVTCFHARVLSEHLEMTMDVLSDIVVNATLTPEDIEVERSVVLEEISMHEDTPDDLVFDVLSEAMFSGQSVGRRIQGFADTVECVTPQQVIDFRNRSYPAARAVLAASGQVDHARLVDMARQAFVSTGNRTPLRPNEPVRATPGVQTVIAREVEQSHVVLGVPGIDRRDHRRWALAVLNAALGGGTSSRLFQSIREQRGLAYHVSSGNQAFTGGGLFTIYAGCAPERAAEVAQIALEIVRDVMQDGLTQAEVDRARGYLRGGLLLGLEEPGSIMNHLGKSALLHGQILTTSELTDHVESVTREDCIVLAQQLFGSVPWSVAVVGSVPDPPVTLLDPSWVAA